MTEFVRRWPRWVFAGAAVLLLTLAGMSLWMRNPSIAPSSGFAHVTRALSAEAPSGSVGEADTPLTAPATAAWVSCLLSS